MKCVASYAIILCLVLLPGCQTETPTSGNNTSSPPSGMTKVVNQLVEASCGECQFGMQGNSCDLAVRIDDKSYFVDGAAIDDHGDAHAADGMCNCIRQAKVSGEIKDGRFKATSFELSPFDEAQPQAVEGQTPSSR